MIEKICEELAVLHVKSEFRPVFEREVRQKALMEAMNIVREVAKEYGEKKYYRIVLSCLEDSTSLEMPLTKQEYLLLTRISDLVYRVAIGCMPTMYVEQKGE